MNTSTTSHPEAPHTIAETGLSEEFLADLSLKVLYSHGSCSGDELAELLKLPFPLVDDEVLGMQQRRLIEVKGAQGPSRANHVYELTGEGRVRAREAMAMSQYVGPAPVPLSQYRLWVASQTIQQVHVTREEVEEAFSWLELNQETLDEVGPAVNSGRSLFLYGASGNGKTAIAETIARLLGGAMYVPYAVEVGGQILVLFDELYHHPVDEPNPDPDGTGIWRTSAEHDTRWVKVTRPVVLTGGELTLDQLDLQWESDTKVYQAPFQVKANGGVLIIDDFGRQRVPPRDLLNRWIVPLEKRVDFLTLHTGTKFPVPFDALLVIATNIDPKELVEEAFLRRIHYKIRVESPTLEQYQAIFSRYCETHGIQYDPAAVRQLYQNFYHSHSIAPRGCHPRDVIDHLIDIAKYLRIVPELSQDLVERAGRSYFLDFPTKV